MELKDLNGRINAELCFSPISEYHIRFCADCNKKTTCGRDSNKHLEHEQIICAIAKLAERIG